VGKEMTTIYSGLFTHKHGFFPTDWTERAIKRQQQYCDHWGFDYRLMTNIPWGQNYPLRHAWSFGTTIKFVALDHFLKSKEKYFTWLDLDVYPTDRAFEYQLPSCNLLYAPFVSWGFSDQPGHEHMKCKREWCGHKKDYFALNTGMFRLERSAVENLWGYINFNHSIWTDAWWEIYHSRQLAMSAESPWLYGSEEAIIEEWLNSYFSLPFDQLSEDVHSVHSENNPIFMHYYGAQKAHYPIAKQTPV
jgi:hypothetical protein